jgi:hypothetical protein
MQAVVMNTTYFNHTGYGPLPFWDDLTNYTTFNNRDFVQQEDEKPVPAATLGLATGAFFIFACGLKKVMSDAHFLLNAEILFMSYASKFQHSSSRQWNLHSFLHLLSFGATSLK